MTAEDRVRANIEKHVRCALKFLEQADEEFAARDQQQASEKLWGAVSQAAMAVGKQRKVPANKSYQRREMAKDLTEEYGEPLIASQYSVAEKFHANFYHDFMEDAEIEADRPKVSYLVHRLIEILEEKARDSQAAR